MLMHVEFYKGGAGRLCGWIATPPHRRPFQGSTMAAGRDLPHDLTQFTIERALGIRDGFWGLLAHGASFASVPGRRPTRAGSRSASGIVSCSSGGCSRWPASWAPAGSGP